MHGVAAGYWNTVALLKLASSVLGLSPHRAMQVAEDLYTAGFISYPRTESTRYPTGFDVSGALSGQEGSTEWGGLVQCACPVHMRTQHPPPR